MPKDQYKKKQGRCQSIEEGPKPPANSDLTLGVGRFGEMLYRWMRGGVALTSLEVLSSVQEGGDNVRLRSFYPF
jgi:hypothetical protein